MLKSFRSAPPRPRDPSAERLFHAGPVSCVDGRRDGRLVSGGYDGRLVVWGAQGRPLQEIAAHGALVNGVAWSPDETRIASASSDHTARVFDAAGRELLVLRGHRDDVNGVAWSPDGRVLATASFDGTARVWDAEDGRLRAVLGAHGADVNGVAFAPDGRSLATASDDGTVRLSTPEGAEILVLGGHDDWVDHVHFHPRRRLLASGSLDGTARIWDLASGRELVRLPHGCTVKAARWSPDGGLLATAAYDKRIRVFESGSFRLVAELVDPIMWNRSLAWTGDGRLATGSFRRTPVTWRPGDPTARHLDRLGSAGINGMALSPRGDFVALACDDGGSRLVDTASGRILRERFDHDGAVLCAAVSPDGRRIAFGGWDDRVTLYEVGSGAPRAVAEGCGEPVNALTFTADGRHVALGSFMGHLLLLDAASGRRVAEPGRHRGSVKSVAALPDGSLLSGGRDGRLRRFGVEGPGDVIEVGDTIVNGVAAAPDGRRVACASRGCGVEVYDLATGTRRASFREHPVSARAVDVSPDGRVVAAGYYDGHLLLWRPDEGRHRLLRPFGAAAVSAVRFAPDGQRLWVSTWDPRGRFGVVDVEAAPEVHDACVTGRFE